MKTALFIEGNNFYLACKSAGIVIDYAKVRKAFGEDVLRAYFYNAVIQDYQGDNTIRPLLDWLDYHNYTVFTKPCKTFEDPLTGQTRVKGNMDVEMAVDMLLLAPYIKHAVLFSGDGDFTYVVKALQRVGVMVTVVSTLTMMADELRRAADLFVDVADPKMRRSIEKDAKSQG